MNLVRSIISFFLLALLAMTVAGWIWAGEQPTRQMIGARASLVVCALCAISCIVVIWRAKPGMAGPATLEVGDAS